MLLFLDYARGVHFAGAHAHEYSWLHLAWRLKCVVKIPGIVQGQERRKHMTPTSR